MSRIRTVWNQDHPHQQMKRFVDSAFKKARALSNEELDALLLSMRPGLAPGIDRLTRSDKLAHIKDTALREWISGRMALADSLPSDAPP